MEQDLFNELLHSVFRFGQIGMTFRSFHPASALNVSMVELAVLKGIKDHVFDSGGTTIPGLLCITRAAVSQMLGVLEQKGYIVRDINRANRRKQSLSLTPKGSAIVEEQERRIAELRAEIFNRFGERETKQFVKLSNTFMDIIEDIKSDSIAV